MRIREKDAIKFKDLGPRTAKLALLLMKIIKYGIVQCL